MHTINTKQFATTKIIVNFSNQMSFDTLGGRVLASNMLETVSADFPSQPSFTRKLSSLYGAELSADVLKIGAVHSLRLTLNMIADKYADDGDGNLLQDGMAFIEQVLRAPLGDDVNGFDLTVFSRQKSISLDEIAGMQEDRGFFAARQAMMAYFDSLAQATPAYGSADLLRGVSALDAWRALQRAKAQDRVDIVVLGEVDENQVLRMARELGFSGRQVEVDPFYHQPQRKELQTIPETAEVNQARLDLIFQLRLDFNDRFRGYVFNAIFGGLPTSRLFMEVRERLGLAYAISSDWNAYTDMLLVEAGIESENLELAVKQILAELDRMQHVLPSQEELTLVKNLMTADYLAAMDNPGQVAERILTQQLIGTETTAEEWQSALEQVTAEDVVWVAQQVTYQLRYTLQGE